MLDPETRNAFLRAKHRVSLPILARKTPGRDAAGFLDELCTTYEECRSIHVQTYEECARTILRYCNRIPSDQPRRRNAYIQACLKRMKRKKRLIDRLSECPDPFDVLDVGEIRELGVGELRAWIDERDAIFEELAELDGESSGTRLLQKKVTASEYQKIFDVLWLAINFSEPGDVQRFQNIMANASRTKFPMKYVRKVISNG